MPFDRLNTVISAVQRGELVDLNIEQFSDDGTSPVRVKGYDVFVQDAVPGDHVQAYIYNIESSYAEAKLDTLLEPSDLRTGPRYSTPTPAADASGSTSSTRHSSSPNVSRGPMRSSTRRDSTIS